MSDIINQAPGWLVHQGPWLVLALGAICGALIPVLLVQPVMSRRQRRPVPWADVATFAAALIATGFALDGMLRVASSRLHMHGIEQYALGGVFEFALLACALRARRNVKEFGAAGLDGQLVWLLAALSGVFGASVGEGIGAAVRFSVPLVAAMLWERGLTLMRRKVQRAPKSIAWKWTTERLAVWLGIAEPAERTTTEVAAARRIARLIKTRIALAGLTADPHSPFLARMTFRKVRAGIVSARLRNQSLAAVEHLGLGTDPTVLERITTTVAAVVNLPELTNPATVGKPAKRAEPTKPRTTTASAPKAHVLPPGQRAVLAADEDRDVITETVPEPPPPQVGDLSDRIAAAAAAARSQGDNKEAIAAMLALDPGMSNAAMGRVLGVSGEAVRQARVRLAASNQEA